MSSLPEPAIAPEQIAAWRQQLDCGFPQVAELFEACMVDASRQLSPDGIHAYLEAARYLGKMGRGAEPVLIFLQEWPQIAIAVGEPALPAVMNAIRAMTKSPNSQAISPFLQSLPAVARRIPSLEQLEVYLDLSLYLMDSTSGSIHGIHKTYASPGLPDYFVQSPHLLCLLTLAGLRNWVTYGVRNYNHHPEQQCDYFSLRSADSHAVLQRERHGTLLVDSTRKLDLYLQGLWQEAGHLVPYATTSDALPQPMPYFDELGIRLPDVYDERNGVKGIDRYRAALAHMAAHKRWSTAIVADNYSPMQRMAIETFEDARVEALAMREYPGLRQLYAALHPIPVEGACNPVTHSCFRHRLAMLSRALLDSSHGFSDVKFAYLKFNEFVKRFHEVMSHGESRTEDMADLALSYVANTRLQSDQLPNTYFTDTEVDYRDDNRHLWRFHELSDDEDMFDNQAQSQTTDEVKNLPPRHYPEWDYASQTYRPHWVSLYECLHPAGNAADIDQLLAKHTGLVKRLKRLLDQLKPQNKVRIRHQEEGSELDLDVAIRSLIDFKSGNHPDTRINMNHRTDGRSIAVTLLLDLSESLYEKVENSTQSILELSQEAVAILAWSIEQLGDPFAIAGFHSNSRHDVQYMHIKGFGEHWNDDVKSRLAAIKAGYSTRMGAAMRHAAHYLVAQQTDKKLMLILTDGQPSDVDVHDERLLIEDAHQAVKELDQQGIFTYCINLDPKADTYVSDIFGQRYVVIDHIVNLPEQLAKLFFILTR